MIDKELSAIFLSLVRIGIGHDEHVELREIDWQAIQALAERQGLLPIVVDGIETLPDAIRPPKIALLRLIGEALQMEQQYALQRKTAVDMARLFHDNCIRTYVLKGEVVAECYPKPEHRISADFDCLLLPEVGEDDVWEKGNQLIENAGYKVGRGFYKNSSFDLPGLMVGNHRFMVPFRGNKRLKSLERLLQRLINDGSAGSPQENENRFEGTWLYRPPVMVSALFLIEHAYSHFLHEGLNWRHVLDWVMFSDKYKDEIDWNQLSAFIDEYGFRKFYDSYHRLGLYLIGEFQDSSFTIQDKLMLDDIWAPLDLHETLHGVKAKFQLAGNYWRARWKYKHFTDTTWVRALFEWVSGAMFDRHPAL